MDEVSVLLLLSPSPRVFCAGTMAGAGEFARPGFPVMSILLNASTSIVPFTGTVAVVGDSTGSSSLPLCSKVSNVLENGLAGACERFLKSSLVSKAGYFVSNESSFWKVGGG